MTETTVTTRSKLERMRPKDYEPRYPPPVGIAHYHLTRPVTATAVVNGKKVATKITNRSVINLGRVEAKPGDKISVRFSATLTRQGVRNLDGPHMDGTGHNARIASCPHYRAPDMIPAYTLSSTKLVAGLAVTTFDAYCSGCDERLYNVDGNDEPARSR
jgi:hypothetical protein